MALPASPWALLLYPYPANNHHNRKNHNHAKNLQVHVLEHPACDFH